MKRIKMLEAARQRAHEMVDDASCLSDARFAELKSLPEETVINRLAVEFLDEALADNKMEDEEPKEEDWEFEDQEDEDLD